MYYDSEETTYKVLEAHFFLKKGMLKIQCKYTGINSSLVCYIFDNDQEKGKEGSY